VKSALYLLLSQFRSAKIRKSKAFEIQKTAFQTFSLSPQWHGNLKIIGSNLGASLNYKLIFKYKLDEKMVPSDSMKPSLMLCLKNVVGKKNTTKNLFHLILEFFLKAFTNESSPH